MWSGGSSAEGTLNGGAEGVNWGEVWGGGISSPVGVESGEGAVLPPQKNFGIFSFEMVHFDAFWSTF